MSMTHCDNCGRRWEDHGTGCPVRITDGPLRPIPHMQMITHDGITHPIGPRPDDWPDPTVTLTTSEDCCRVGRFKLTRGYLNQLWLYNNEGEGMQVDETKLEAVLDKFFKENF